MSKDGGIGALLGESATFERVSTVDQVAGLLRDLILSGELKPGSRLPEIPISQSLGVSRNTVREAIPILSAEGLLRREIHRGAVVVALEPNDVEDLYRVRRVIELSAIELTREPDLGPLRQAVDGMEAAAGAGDRRTLIEADTEFHSAVAALLGSPRLDRFFAQIATEMRLAIAILTTDEVDGHENPLGDEEDLATVAAEHRAIYEDMVRDDLKSARRRLRAHLDHNEARLSAIMGELFSRQSES